MVTGHPVTISQNSYGHQTSGGNVNNSVVRCAIGMKFSQVVTDYLGVKFWLSKLLILAEQVLAEQITDFG